MSFNYSNKTENFNFIYFKFKTSSKEFLRLDCPFVQPFRKVIDCAEVGVAASVSVTIVRNADVMMGSETWTFVWQSIYGSRTVVWLNGAFGLVGDGENVSLFIKLLDVTILALPSFGCETSENMSR